MSAAIPSGRANSLLISTAPSQLLASLLSSPLFEAERGLVFGAERLLSCHPPVTAPRELPSVKIQANFSAPAFALVYFIC
jgi:hypothetical protein